MSHRPALDPSQDGAEILNGEAVAVHRKISWFSCLLTMLYFF
jgi:hypothetical protein